MSQGEGRPVVEADERALLRELPLAPNSPPLPLAPRPAPPKPTTRLGIDPGRAASLPRAITSAMLSALRDEEARGSVFLFLPVVLGVGAIIYFALPVEPPLSGIVLGMVVLGPLAWVARHRTQARLLLVSVFLVVAGMLAGKVETLRLATPMLGAGVTTHVTGRVRSISRDERGHVRMTIDVLSTSRPRLRYGPDRIRAWARKVPDDMTVGSGMSGLVRLLPQSGPLRPNGYDFAFQGYFDGIGARAFLLGEPKVVAISSPSNPLERLGLAAARLRSSLTARIRADIGGQTGAVAAALITGEKAGIADDVNEALRVSGLAHLLSISGLHMALVAGTIMLVLRAMMALFPGYAARHAVKKQAAVAALVMAAVYLVLSGAGIATQRSFIMLLVMLLAVLADRSAITMRNLAIAALIIIVVAPHEIVGPSFQMSFAATAALIAAYAWWSGRRRGQADDAKGRGVGFGLFGRAVRLVAGIAATSLIAGIATGIFAAFHFNRLAPLGFVANVLAVPVFSIAVMPLGILGVVAMPFDLDGLPLRLMGHGIGVVIGIARWVAGLSPNGGTGLMPESALLLLALALVAASMLATRLRLAAVPLAAVGLFAFYRERPPDIAVSEDARLAVVRTGDGSLAVSRSRPNAFTLNDWKRAYRATHIVKVAKVPSNAARHEGFVCQGHVCTAGSAGGYVVAYASAPDGAETACRSGDVVILAYGAPRAHCAQEDRLVVTARELALEGALEIRLPRGPPDNAAAGQNETATRSLRSEYRKRLSRAVLSFALAGSLERPWHAQRRYLRAARGLPPYRSRSRKRRSRQKASRNAQ